MHILLLMKNCGGAGAGGRRKNTCCFGILPPVPVKNTATKKARLLANPAAGE